MQQALGLSGSAAIMFAITVALGVAGILALLMALFWPRRWRLHYRLEIGFVVLLLALVIYADVDSGRTYQTYEAALPDPAALSSTQGFDAKRAGFDREVRVYAFQWGFIFFDEDGKASRNAVKVSPGEKVLFNIMSNDVIHGLNIPAARMTTELDPGGVRSIWIRAPNAPGKYLIQCLNYCGVGHAQMKAWLVVEGAAHQETSGKPHG
jgi:heme/copper-type cytochrome/quinol oxidase subunit 2